MKSTKTILLLALLFSSVSIGASPAAQGFSPLASTWTLGTADSANGLDYQATLDYSKSTNAVRINSIRVSASVPGVRVSADVCAKIEAYSAGTLVKQAETCKHWQPGVTVSTMNWYVTSNSFRLTPSGNSTYVRVSFKGTYVSAAQTLSCGGGSGLCGLQTIVFTFVN